jgi:hypothetical protein
MVPSPTRAKAYVGRKISAAVARGAKRIDQEARTFAIWAQSIRMAVRTPLLPVAQLIFMSRLYRVIGTGAKIGHATVSADAAKRA